MAKKTTETTTEIDTTEKTSEKVSKKEKKASKEVVDFSKITPAKLQEMRSEYFQYKLDVTTGKQKDVSKLRQLRRDIARAHTFLAIKLNQ